jgi:hypothetical protein
VKKPLGLSIIFSSHGLSRRRVDWLEFLGKQNSLSPKIEKRLLLQRRAFFSHLPLDYTIQSWNWHLVSSPSMMG